MTEEKEKTKEVTPKCPSCGSENLGLPKHIEKRDDGVYIKGSDLQLLTLPDPAYTCLDCGRDVTAHEVMRFLGINDATLVME